MMSDIEIYYKGKDLTLVEKWLTKHFGEISGPTTLGVFQQYQVTFQDQPLLIKVWPKVAKNYSSIWFDSNATPWESDIACAQDFFAHTNTNVRCVKGTWQQEEDPDLWWDISEHGEKEVIWKT